MFTYRWVHRHVVGTKPGPVHARAASGTVSIIALLLLAACTTPGGNSNPPTAPTLTTTVTDIKTLTFAWTDVAEETEYRLLHDATGAGTFDLLTSLPADATQATHDVFVPTAVTTSYALEACNARGCSRSDEIGPGNELAAAIGYFKATNTGPGDQLGWSLALSADGKTLAIGAANEDSDATGVGGDQNNDNAENSGAVYLYTRDSTGDWTHQAYIKATNTGDGDEFGRSVALSADGNTLAVGAPREGSDATGVGGDQNNDNAATSGAVYIYTRNSTGAWTNQAYIKSTNTTAVDRFGYSVALSADGNTLAVGANGEDSDATGVGGDQNNDNSPSSGAVYVYTRDTNSVWANQAYVKATNTGQSDRFGHSVALTGDGNTLAVGAVWEESDATGVGGDQNNDNEATSGAVYLYTRDSTGAWTNQAYIKATNTGSGDEFGRSVALSADGDTLAVGAPVEGSDATGVGGDQNNDSAFGSGAVYVYARDSTDAWTPRAYIKATNTDPGDAFGHSVTLSVDGDTLAVSAYLESSNATGIGGNQNDNSAIDSGAAYLYTRDTNGAWTNQSYIKATNTGPSDVFGRIVALSGDGTTLAIGAPAESSDATGIGGNQNDDNAIESGAVYLY